MKFLLIDNSNSRTKFALGDERGLLSGWRGMLPTPEIEPDRLAVLLEGIDFQACLIGSVVPRRAEILKAFLSDRGPLHLLDHRSPLGFAIDYPEPGQIGADRLANAVGVTARHGVPAVVIDFGTAVTFDVVSSAPAYCGGVIAPGLGAMTGYLPEKTALLPVIEPEEPASAIGKSTVHAMQVGAMIGYRGMVRGILQALVAEMGPPQPRLIATGGDATRVAAGLPEITAVDPDLTLDGLRIVACRVFGMAAGLELSEM